jgi:hypothetical protein
VLQDYSGKPDLYDKVSFEFLQVLQFFLGIRPEWTQDNVAGFSPVTFLEVVSTLLRFQATPDAARLNRLGATQHEDD